MLIIGAQTVPHRGRSAASGWSGAGKLGCSQNSPRQIGPYQMPQEDSLPRPEILPSTPQSCTSRNLPATHFQSRAVTLSQEWLHLLCPPTASLHLPTSGRAPISPCMQAHTSSGCRSSPALASCPWVGWDGRCLHHSICLTKCRDNCHICHHSQPPIPSPNVHSHIFWKVHLECSYRMPTPLESL